ncbi:MAG: YicC/YloC family endoribonuclease [Rikenellaceae bacterium]|nr:YicC/YloC family endoribonuclease [Rikenellaceae bacterium]
MVKSMTGFGRGEATIGAKRLIVEIRTLNSKQLDLNLRMPAIYRALEGEIRSLLQQRLQRGKADVFVTVESQQVESPAHVNSKLFAEYVSQIANALNAADMEISYDSIAQMAMRMPEVISTEVERLSDEEGAAVKEAVRTACDALDAFREQEGKILIADLLQRIDLIEGYKEEVIPFEEQRVATIRTRILDHIQKLGVEVDSSRLEQELIFYIEKLDITEEKVRLKNHCNYFREVAASEEGVGRKLGFIAQELGREINTMGSKANETNIQILVVKMKDELEKIKEQVLNIL